MASRWQYQQLAEPVSESPETTIIDKWSPTFPDLRRPVLALTAAIVAGSFFFNDIAFPQTFEPATHDYVIERHYPKPALPPSIQSGSYFAGDWQEEQTVRISDSGSGSYCDIYHYRLGKRFPFRLLL
jgi:hypothetical protein